MEVYLSQRDLVLNKMDNSFSFLHPVLATSFVTSHTSTAFTFYMRCIILFSASQRHRAWDTRPKTSRFLRTDVPDSQHTRLEQGLCRQPAPAGLIRTMNRECSQRWSCFHWSRSSATCSCLFTLLCTRENPNRHPIPAISPLD